MAWSYKRKAKGQSQVAIFHKYARACELTEEERRQVLFEETGFRTSKAPQLTQADFDRVMCRLENRLRWMLDEALVTGDDLKRQRINPRLDYWLKRNKDGAANSRLRRAMCEAWHELQQLLPVECCNEAWLLGFVEKCSGASDFWTASQADAGRILDGLRQRIRQEERKRTKATTEDAQ